MVFVGNKIDLRGEAINKSFIQYEDARKKIEAETNCPYL